MLDSLLLEILLMDDELQQMVQSVGSFQYFYARTGFDTRTFFAGREIGTNQTNMTGQLYYLHSFGIFAGASGAWYSDMDPGYRSTILSIGYSKLPMGRQRLSYRVSYNHFLFNTGDPDFEPAYNGSLNGGTTMRFGNVRTRLNGAMLIGREIGWQASWDLTARINLLRWSRFNRLRFEPGVSLYWGAEWVEYELKNVFAESFSENLFTTDFRQEFGLLNTELEFPLVLTWKYFDLDVSWIVNVPRTLDSELQYPVNSYFRFSVGYMFGL